MKHFVINFLTRKLLKAISEEEILQLTDQGFLLEKKKLPPEAVSTLKEEANLFSESLLWELMTKEIAYLAQIKMFEQARTTDDIIFGKAMLYNLDLLRKFLNRLK